jgi:hypothetical protein
MKDIEIPSIFDEDMAFILRVAPKLVDVNIKNHYRV